MRWFDKPRPWLLLASLVANFFFVGLITATIVAGPFGRHAYPPPVRYMLKAAGPDAKSAIDRAMAARDAEMRVAGDAYQSARAAATAAMTAQVVDPERLRETLAAKRVARNRLTELMEDAFVEVLPHLGPEARREMMERRWRGKDRDGPKRD